MTTRAKLLDVRSTLGATVRAGEPWEESYKKDRKSFRRLLAEEQSLERDVAEHFYRLATERLSKLINWTDVMPKLTADVVVPGNDQAVQEEEQLLVTVVLPHVEELMFIGLAAGEAVSSIPADYPSLTPTILESARKDTAALVSGVTDTTRATIQKTIKSSLARREDLSQMTARLVDVVNNPVRAEMIAQTETVNAYQAGFAEFALASGATEKEWESKAGACQLCRPLDGKRIPARDLFELPNGRQVFKPTAHVRCRCGLIWIYPDSA